MTADTSFSPRRTALVVRGGWDGHQPEETTDLFIPFLEEHGFTVVVEGSPARYADNEFMRTVDLIVQCTSMGAIAEEEVAGLRSAVEAGTGLAGWHGGIVDSYRQSADYLHLVGGQFAAHPGRRLEEPTGEQSDNYVPYTVQMLPAAAAHPITEGIGDFDLVTEQYWVLSDEYNDVLATVTQPARDGDPWRRPVTSPAIWTRQWGEGRVFVSTPGHRVEVLESQPLGTIVERGLLWAAR